MKFSLKPVLVAAAFLMAGGAHAASESVTLDAGGPSVSALNIVLSDLAGSGTLTFSNDLMGALAVAQIVTTEVSPATLAASPTTIAATAPVASLSVTVDDVANNFTATHVGTLGGARLTAANPNFATDGGWLEITNIQVDLPTQRILADVSGANGAGSTSGVHVWNYANIAGDITFPSVDGVSEANNTLTGLVITQGAFNLFAQSLGLRAGGIGAMASITDYGVMTASITANVAVVPEPSAILLMAAGLGVVGFAAKRRRAA